MAPKFCVFRVQDPVGHPLPNALLEATSTDWPPGWSGRTAIEPEGDPPKGYFYANLGLGGYELTISHPQWRTRRMHVDILENQGHDAPIVIGLDPPGGGGGGGNGGGGGVVLPLVTRGGFFALSSGEYWTAIECTDFQLFQRWLHGEDITAILVQRRDVGFNLLRVALSCAQMFRLDPAEYNVSAMLPDFIVLLAAYGLRAEFVVFMDATIIMPRLGDQQVFFARVCEAVRRADNLSLVELVNENDQTVNTINVTSFQPPSGILTSHGSNGSQQPPVRPWWGYETFHTNDAFEWQRKVGHNSMEFSDGAEGLVGAHVPILANENTRCPDRFNSPILAYDAAAGAALLCAGSCFHSVDGKFSQLWGSIELECAIAWAKGARSVPLEFQDGRYNHAKELETPDVLRAYQRILGDGRAHTVLIHKAV